MKEPSTTDTSREGDHEWLLVRGIKSILRCDEAAVVLGIADYIVSQHRSLRLLSWLIEKTRGTPFPGVIALIGWLRSFLSVRPGNRNEGAVWIARLSNERRALEGLPRLVPEVCWTECEFCGLPDGASVSALVQSAIGGAHTQVRAYVKAKSRKHATFQNLRRIFRMTRRLHRRNEFFKVLRVVELIAYYTRYLQIFQNARFSIALMSSHSNPHGIAFNLAARKCGIPTVLITHGMPVRPVARLRYDLAVVHCEAARLTYLEEGCRMDCVLIHGRRQLCAPMPLGPLPDRLNVGIFLCKDVNEQRLRVLIEHLLEHLRVSCIIIRPHPKNLWLGLDAWLASLRNSRVKLSGSGSVFRDLEASDIVLGGNSSVLVDAVTAGRPSGYVTNLDHGSSDLHEFVARGLIHPLDDELRFDPDALLRFYQQPEWASTLRLFANIDEDDASVATQFGVSLRDLIASNGADGGNGVQGGNPSS